MVKKMAGNGLGTFALLDEFTGNGRPADPRRGAQHRNLLQAWVLKNTRLGIPILFHGEALHGAVSPGATSFPEAVGLGSTWDPELLQKMFTTVALESRAAGNALVLAPVLDLSRDPRYGRVEEMYSEDPYLVAQLGTAAVKGLQGLTTATIGWMRITSTPRSSTLCTGSRRTEPMSVPMTSQSAPCAASSSTRSNRW